MTSNGKQASNETTPASGHVTATTSAHVTSPAGDASMTSSGGSAVQTTVVTRPATMPGGSHQLYQVLPVVQNGVPCRLLVPLNMVAPLPKTTRAGLTVTSGGKPMQLAADSSKFVLQQVKVVPPGSQASPAGASALVIPQGSQAQSAGTSAVVHVLSPSGDAAGKDGKGGAVIATPVGVSASSGPGLATASTSAVQKVVTVTPTVAPGNKPPVSVQSPAGKTQQSTVLQVPPVSVQSPAGRTQQSTALQVPPASVQSPAVYNIIKVTPPPAGGTLTIGPNTRLVVVSAPSTGVTQSLGPRTSAALGSVAVVPPTFSAPSGAKASGSVSVPRAQPSLPAGKPMIATSAGQNKIVIVPQFSSSVSTAAGRAVTTTAGARAAPASTPAGARAAPASTPAAPKQVSMVQQNENVVLINGQPYKLIPCPTTTHIPVDVLKSTAATATVSTATVSTATVSAAATTAAKGAATATVSSTGAQTAGPVPISCTTAAQSPVPVRPVKSTALTHSEGTSSKDRVDGVTSTPEGTPGRGEKEGSGSQGTLGRGEKSGSETESAPEVSPARPVDASKAEQWREDGREGTTLKIDSVYSLKGDSKPDNPAPKPSKDTPAIAQDSRASDTLKNIAHIHSATVNRPKKYIVVYPNKPSAPPSPPVKPVPIVLTSAKLPEPVKTVTPPVSPARVPAAKEPSPQPPSPPVRPVPIALTSAKLPEPVKSVTPPVSPARAPAGKDTPSQPCPQPEEKRPPRKTPPKSVTEMYHSYARPDPGPAGQEAPPPAQLKRSVTALMVRTTPVGKSSVALGGSPGPSGLPPSKIFRLEPPRPNETIQDERVRRLKEILREREAAVEELRKRKQTS